MDRQKSVRILQTFLSEKDAKLAVEVAWLTSVQIDCVLSDSAFLAWCVISSKLEAPKGYVVLAAKLQQSLVYRRC